MACKEIEIMELHADLEIRVNIHLLQKEDSTYSCQNGPMAYETISIKKPEDEWPVAYMPFADTTDDLVDDVLICELRAALKERFVLGDHDIYIDLPLLLVLDMKKRAWEAFGEKYNIIGKCCNE